jgi:Fur family transcriptional regulator, stress-responsive regulator
VAARSSWRSIGEVVFRGDDSLQRPRSGRPADTVQTPKYWSRSKHVIYHAGVADDPADLLRRRGIQVTAQRLAVLRAVAGRPHIAADAVGDAVRAEIGAISLQSVYDALGVLVAEGLIRRIQPAGSPARFEDRVGDNHHHLICRICGRMVDVDCAIGSAPCLAAVDDRGYEIDEAEVVYWGRCPDCVARSQPPASAPATAGKRSRSETRARPKPLDRARGKPLDDARGKPLDDARGKRRNN